MGTDFIGAGRYNYNTKGSVEAVTLPLGSAEAVTLLTAGVVLEDDLRQEWLLGCEEMFGGQNSSPNDRPPNYANPGRKARSLTTGVLGSHVPYENSTGRQLSAYSLADIWRNPLQSIRMSCMVLHC